MLQQASIIALIVLFLHACTWDGMIFSGVKRLIKPELEISKPLYGCPICMAFWWGTAIYLLFFGWVSVINWACVIGSACGLSVFSVVAIDVKDYCVNVVQELEGKLESE